MLEGARTVLESARRLDIVAAELRGGWESELHVVIDGVVPLAPVLEALKRFGDRGLPTRVQLEVEYQSGVAARFERSQADLMLLIEFEGSPHLDSIAVPPLDVLLVTNPEHPLAGRTAVERTDLLRHAELVVKDSSPDYAEAPREAWFGSAHVVHFTDFHSKRLALLSGVGFGWMPDHLVRDDLASGALVMVDALTGNRWTYHPHIAFSRNTPMGRAAGLFRDFLVEAFGDD